MQNLPQSFQFRMVAGGLLDKKLDVKCWGVYVSNYTAQWVEMPDANEFIPPNTRQIIALAGTYNAKARFNAPDGVVQPASASGQTCLFTFTERAVQPSGGVVGAAVLASVTQVERFTKALLPAAGTAGRLALLTDYDRGLWKDTGTQWASAELDIFNVHEFNATGLGIADDTTAINNTIAALPTLGGMVRASSGNYKITGTIDFISHMRWLGDFSARFDTDSVDRGTRLLWAGGVNGTMVRILGREFVTVDGLHIDGGGVSGVTGLLIDSTNAPATRQVHLAKIAVTLCGTTGTNGTGIQFGVPGSVTDYQMDAFTLRDFEINVNFTGIRVDSYNAMSLSEISNGVIRNFNRGIYLVRSGTIAIRHVTFGGIVYGATPAAIDVITTTGALLIDTCQSEGAGITFLRATGSNASPITLLNCIVNQPCEVHGTRSLIIIGGYYSENITIYDGTSVELYNVSFLAGKGIVRDATSTGRIVTHDTSAVPVETVDTKADGAQFLINSNAANPSLRLQNSSAAPRLWDIIASGTGGLNPGGLLFRDSTGLTNPFYINSAALENALRILATGVQHVGVLYPSTPAAVTQTACSIYAGTGVPVDAQGANGDIYFRSDGGAATTIYQRRAGVWVATGA